MKIKSVPQVTTNSCGISMMLTIGNYAAQKNLFSKKDALNFLTYSEQNVTLVSEYLNKFKVYQIPEGIVQAFNSWCPFMKAELISLDINDFHDFLKVKKAFGMVLDLGYMRHFVVIKSKRINLDKKFYNLIDTEYPEIAFKVDESIILNKGFPYNAPVKRIICIN